MDFRHFHTSPILGIEAIAGLIPIYLHLQNSMEDSISEHFPYPQTTPSN